MRNLLQLVREAPEHYRLQAELAGDLEKTAARVLMSETAIVEDALRDWLFNKGRQLLVLRKEFNQVSGSKN